ncbi:HAD family hydrolase [Streptomyces sp. NBC_00503]|uniref:HAD family hydrolase n=1 Tax=Streptomyces sp. NBC_00503 TaxID=2903659 RepID=UPI002E81CA53|nr:HAD-IB family hydrolase [Streptomyces sp. NBC_00503]WUD86388.1 HAD-IB family hydrolase [Streptomyces sp. NBC_00503]
MSGSGRAAFFDVDETLLAGKSMLGFWRYWSTTAEGRGYAHRFETLRPLLSGGAPREEANRAYYRMFAGLPAAHFERAAQDWYETLRTGPEMVIVPVYEALVAHRERGDLIVLVSGSPRPLLEPLARDVGADQVVCAEQVVADGRLTGEIGRQVIGDGKGGAASRIMARLGLAAERCWAYADHQSDLALLQSVGHPVVVGEDRVLTEHAVRRGWQRLPALHGPMTGQRSAPRLLVS